VADWHQLAETLWAEGWTQREITKRLIRSGYDVTRNAVIGHLDRVRKRSAIPSKVEPDPPPPLSPSPHTRSRPYSMFEGHGPFTLRRNTPWRRTDT
jgi:hypothetical protein